MIVRIIIASLVLAASAEAAPRVMSTDFCADQFLLKLADREQIAALSPDADNDFSYHRDLAGGLPKVRPQAEEVVARKPDVVLRFWGGNAPRMEKLGAQVVTLDYATNFDTVRKNIRTAATALGQPERGETLIAEMDTRLSVLPARTDSSRQTLYITPGGVTAGKGTIIDAILNAAGVINITAEKGFSFWPPLPAEAVVETPPELIITGFFDANSERINHWSTVRHPAFRKVFEKTPVIHLPTNVLSCPAWFSIDAAEMIASSIGGARED